MNVIGIGNYGLFNSNYAKKTSTEEVLASTSFADAKRVEDFIAGFKNDENLKFAGIKEFWTMFLKGNITKDNLVQSGDTWEWIQ